MAYQHTQWEFTFVVGYLFLVWFLIEMTSVGGGMPDLVMVAFLVMVALVVPMFSRLKVTVDDKRIVASFTYGLPRRIVELEDVAAVYRVRNKWRYQFLNAWASGGFYRRRPYQVWGLDAIELELTSGKVFRIGTNDPEGLLAAVTRNMGLSSHDREMVGGHSTTASRTPRENLFTPWRSVGRWLRG